jgi:hypothetical protein
MSTNLANYSTMECGRAIAPLASRKPNDSGRCPLELRKYATDGSLGRDCYAACQSIETWSMDRCGGSAYIPSSAQFDMGNCERTGDGSSNETRASVDNGLQIPASACQCKSIFTCSGTHRYTHAVYCTVTLYMYTQCATYRVL